MIMDSLLEFSVAQEVAAAGASTNVLDTFVEGSPNLIVDYGAGEPVWLVVQLAKGNTVTTGDIGVQLQTSDQEDMTGAVTLSGSGTVDLSTVKNGRIWAVRLPSAGYKRYLALNYTSGAAGLLIDAFIVKDLQANIPYQSGFSIT